MTQVELKIAELKEALGEMAAAAQDMVDLALRVVMEGDQEAAEQVRKADKELNRRDLDLDHRCENLLALQAPYAVDFRFVFSTIKTTRDLERIGDESKLVARWAKRLEGQASEALRELANATRDELADAVVALRTNDVKRAQAVLEADSAIDDMEHLILKRTESIPEAFVAYALERIGDRAKNIAENVIYVVSAVDVRHPANQESGDQESGEGTSSGEGTGA